MQHVLHLACLQLSKIKTCSFLPGMLCVDFWLLNFPKQGVIFCISTSAGERVGDSSGFSLKAKEKRTGLCISMQKALPHLRS